MCQSLELRKMYLRDMRLHEGPMKQCMVISAIELVPLTSLAIRDPAEAVRKGLDHGVKRIYWRLRHAANQVDAINKSFT